jgi:molybdenum cofactor biosynthesis enzyme MoaA
VSGIFLYNGGMELDRIGFYTLSEARARQTSGFSPMWRGEIILTGKCNFKCSYCQGLPVKNDIPLALAHSAIDIWSSEHLKNIRFSGGEPTLYNGLQDLIQHSHQAGVDRIALSTNGTASPEYYKQLIQAGLNDVAISLDSSMPSLAKRIAQVNNSQWERVVENIKILSVLTYVAVSVVFTDENLAFAQDIIRFAHGLGVADIRITTASQYNRTFRAFTNIEQEILEAHPILNYRIQNYRLGRNVRGIREADAQRCHLVKDDCVLAGMWHYPCGVYLRERGTPIGVIDPDMRKQRLEWFHSHNTHEDAICHFFCSDIYVDYNNRCESLSATRSQIAIKFPAIK